MNLTRWMTDTVTLAASSGVSTSGDPTWSAQREIAARVVWGHDLVRQSDGTEIESSVKVATHDAVTMGDRIWLPGDDTSSTEEARKPISISHATLPGCSLTLYEVVL